VVSAELFEEEAAGSLLEAVPLCGWRGEVRCGVFALLGGGLDGGDGLAVGAELRTRAGAVVRVLGLGWLGFRLVLFGVALVLGEVGGG
jgi:NAD(P)H-hydrate repair Nnr-like enzyme with NAD(P)H-hydrate epimerase domain